MRQGGHPEPAGEPEPITYDGADCLSGACAFCNSEHPEHHAAVAEHHALFGAPCSVCGSVEPTHALELTHARAFLAAAPRPEPD